MQKPYTIGGSLTYSHTYSVSSTIPVHFGELNSWNFGAGRRFGSHLTQPFHWVNEETEAQWEKALIRATLQSRDTAQTHARFTTLSGSPPVSRAPCTHGTLSGARHAAEPSSASGTHIYSHHMLCAELAALNYAPGKGLSSHQGFDTSLPGRLCWATIWSPESFRAKRQRRQMDTPGDLSFPEDSARLPLSSPKAGGRGSMAGGREAVIHPSPLGAWKRLTYSCTWRFSKRAEKSSFVSSVELRSVRFKEPRTPECWLKDTQGLYLPRLLTL